ncbi:MAG: SGNH/GDSL hydrolase family protein [Anaerolineae bacterium]|nr:SGNH/GDSL hydrolase family protein [Anaerolineae bacterium]
MTLSRRLFPVIAVLIGLLGACALVEIGARLLGIFSPPPLWAQELAAQTGYMPQPNARYTYPDAPRDVTEFEIEVRLNARGLHDVDHTLDKPAGVYRILLLGDSFVQAREVPIEANFTRRLEAMLNRPDSTVYEVINAGRYGFGAAQELLYYRHEGYRYGADRVLLFFYIENDVIDSSARLAMDWYGLDQMTFPYFEQQDGALTLHTPGAGLPTQVGRWLRYNLFTANAVSNWMLSASQGAQREAVAGEITEDIPLPLEVYLPPDARWAAGWDLVAALLRQLRDEVEDDGAAFGVVIIDGNAAMHWEDTLAKYPGFAAQSPDPGAPRERLRAILNDANIAYLDPTETIKARLAAGEPLYYEYDGHFAPAGHALMAEVVYAWLQTDFNRE